MGKKIGQLDTKPAYTPFSSGFVVSKTDSLTTEEEKEDMPKVPYQSLIGTLMYATFCTCSDILFAIGSLSKVLANPG